MTNGWSYRVGEYIYTDAGRFHMPETTAASWATTSTAPQINYYITLCQWCGKSHGRLCPHVKEIEYHENGTVKRVVFTNGDEQFNDMKDFLSTLEE